MNNLPLIDIMIENDLNLTRKKMYSYEYRLEISNTCNTATAVDFNYNWVK